VPLKISKKMEAAQLPQQLALYRCAFEVFEHISEHGLPESLDLQLNGDGLLLQNIPTELPLPNLECAAARLFDGSVSQDGQAWLLQVSAPAEFPRQPGHAAFAGAR